MGSEVATVLTWCPRLNMYDPSKYFPTIIVTIALLLIQNNRLLPLVQNILFNIDNLYISQKLFGGFKDVVLQRNDDNTMGK